MKLTENWYATKINEIMFGQPTPIALCIKTLPKIIEWNKLQ